MSCFIKIKFFLSLTAEVLVGSVEALLDAVALHGRIDALVRGVTVELAQAGARLKGG